MFNKEKRYDAYDIESNEDIFTRMFITNHENCLLSAHDFELLSREEFVINTHESAKWQDIWFVLCFIIKCCLLNDK